MGIYRQLTSKQKTYGRVTNSVRFKPCRGKAPSLTKAFTTKSKKFINKACSHNDLHHKRLNGLEVRELPS
jgi:hypothetical protein